MFFTGHENQLNYRRDVDLTFGASSAKTSLLATFKGDFGRAEVDGVEAYVGMDGPFFEDFHRLCRLYGRDPADETFSLSLVFSPSGTPTYQFFPNLRKPRDSATQAAISRTQRQLVSDLLSKFSCHYIPSAKSVEQLYEEILNPFLTRVAARAVEPQVAALADSLSHVADNINRELNDVGIEDLKASFSFPGAGVESMLSRVAFELSDRHKTAVTRKGQGIQSTALIAALRWVTAEERGADREAIWLLEEPESYLHPELMTTVRGLLKRLGDDSHLVLSTHSLAFVPDVAERVVGVDLDDEGRTVVRRFSSAVEAGEKLRAALGVRFSDYYNLSERNVLVEGASDREIIRWYLDMVPAAEAELPRLRSAHVRDFGGVKHLSGWLRATYALIRDERAVVTMFDGDSAGDKERADLQRFFGQKQVPFQANREYVIVRAGFPIECLFPDAWMIDAQVQHPGWFHDIAVDASGQLQSLRMNDNSKNQIMNYLVARAESEEGVAWRKRLDDVANALDEGLRIQRARLGYAD